MKRNKFFLTLANTAVLATPIGLVAKNEKVKVRVGELQGYDGEIVEIEVSPETRVVELFWNFFTGKYGKEYAKDNPIEVMKYLINPPAIAGIMEVASNTFPVDLMSKVCEGNILIYVERTVSCKEVCSHYPKLKSSKLQVPPYSCCDPRDENIIICDPSLCNHWIQSELRKKGL